MNGCQFSQPLKGDQVSRVKALTMLLASLSPPVPIAKLTSGNAISMSAESLSGNY
jgi:hypothetical protein